VDEAGLERGLSFISVTPPGWAIWPRECG